MKFLPWDLQRKHAVAFGSACEDSIAYPAGNCNSFPENVTASGTGTIEKHTGFPVDWQESRCVWTDYRVSRQISQNATALAAATFRESTPWNMGILTV